MESPPGKLETDVEKLSSFSTERSEENQAQAGKGGIIPQQPAFPSGLCSKGADGQEAESVGKMSGFAVFDAVSASLVRTLEVEPADQVACSAEMVYEWCSSFGRVHCITQSLNSRLRVTVTYLDARDCERAKDEFAKVYPAIALECSSDEPDHDLTGALPPNSGYSVVVFKSLLHCCPGCLVCSRALAMSIMPSNSNLSWLDALRAVMRGFSSAVGLDAYRRRIAYVPYRVTSHDSHRASSAPRCCRSPFDEFNIARFLSSVHLALLQRYCICCSYLMLP